ncbi:SDR family NAD(P)-dependent oxidoreductase [Paenibacillus sp. TAB 01]|uniref:SDR family NAD(P)-dependent oxidoreductase n=1 Tax=Paenibacillus sp. TAB 01 TaxID=3368988 RepID=UPI00375196CF
MNNPFNGKKVIITGAAGLIGSWIAKAFAGQGAALWLVDINPEALDRLVSDPVFVQAADIKRQPLDLRDSQAIAAFAQEVGQAWGAPDILINNAGVYPSQMLVDMSIEQWNHVIGLNLTAPFELTRAMGQMMIRHQVQGSIVNLISKSAFVPRVGAGHYAVSKAGLEMLTRAFALELAPYHIRVNAVSPGFTPGSTFNVLDDNYVQAVIKTIPLGRPAESGDASQTILFLCSPAASYITGTTITVDGGNSAGNFSLPPSREQ